MTVPAGEWNAASLFADAYVRYLDGTAAVSHLAYATAAVRRQASADGRIPPRARKGTLLLKSLQPTSGAHSFALIARNATYSFSAQEQLREVHGSWQVVSLLPPDFDQTLAPTVSGPSLPSGSTAAHKTAVTFLTTYLPWYYGHGPIIKAKDATPALIAHLKANPPNVPPAMSKLHGKATAVGMERHGSEWIAQANITDGESTYQLNLTVAKKGGKWLVTAVTAS